MWIFVLIFMSACSSLDFQNSRRSDYDSYLTKNLEEERLFIQLRETAAAKFIEVTPKMSELQAQLIPGFEVKPTPDQTLFLVSIEMPEWARFAIQDFHFLWGEEKSKSVKEIWDPHLLQTAYPFAVPHDRLFMVEFSRPAVRPPQVKLQTPQGQFVFKVKN